MAAPEAANDSGQGPSHARCPGSPRAPTKLASPEEIQADTDEDERHEPGTKTSSRQSARSRQVPGQPPPTQLSKAEQKIAATIRQHYYPEGGWGWIICVCVFLVNFLTWGVQLNYGVFQRFVVEQFGEEHATETGE